MLSCDAHPSPATTIVVASRLRPEIGRYPFCFLKRRFELRKNRSQATSGTIRQANRDTANNEETNKLHANIRWKGNDLSMTFDKEVANLATHDLPSQVARYMEALKNLPRPGDGCGLHTRLLGVANIGVRANISPTRICQDIRQSIPVGGRAVPDSEIQDAVKKAAHDGGTAPAPILTVRPRVAPALLRWLIEQGKGRDEEFLRKASPLPPGAEGLRQTVLLLLSLYDKNEFLFIGDRIDKRVLSVAEWLELASYDRPLGPFIIPNPVTGRPGPTKSGGQSFRSDSNVGAFRFAVVEFDNLSREDQLAFWSTVNLPVAALVDTGGKSIHGWVRVDCADRQAWENTVEHGLFGERLVPLGVDAACRNESRLSRMPGYPRAETGRIQRLLYLAPGGRRVQP
jgi:hypothetical protein